MCLAIKEWHLFYGWTFSRYRGITTQEINSPLQLGSAHNLWSLSFACLDSMSTRKRPRQAQILVLGRILGHVSPWLLRIWNSACAIPGLVLSTETSNSAGRGCAPKYSPNLFSEKYPELDRTYETKQMWYCNIGRLSGLGPDFIFFTLHTEYLLKIDVYTSLSQNSVLSFNPLTLSTRHVNWQEKPTKRF